MSEYWCMVVWGPSGEATRVASFVAENQHAAQVKVEGWLRKHIGQQASYFPICATNEGATDYLLLQMYQGLVEQAWWLPGDEVRALEVAQNTVWSLARGTLAYERVGLRVAWCEARGTKFFVMKRGVVE